MMEELANFALATLLLAAIAAIVYTVCYLFYDSSQARKDYRKRKLMERKGRGCANCSHLVPTPEDNVFGDRCDCVPRRNYDLVSATTTVRLDPCVFVVGTEKCVWKERAE